MSSAQYWTLLTISDELRSLRRFFCPSHKIISPEDGQRQLFHVHSCPVSPSSSTVYTKEGIRMAVATTQHVLSDDILTRCAERAPVYDRENRFFTEDFEELRDAGYLLMNVPEELEGMGLSLAQVCQEQRRLA